MAIKGSIDLEALLFELLMVSGFPRLNNKMTLLHCGFTRGYGDWI